MSENYRSYAHNHAYIVLPKYCVGMSACPAHGRTKLLALLAAFVLLRVGGCWFHHTILQYCYILLAFTEGVSFFPPDRSSSYPPPSPPASPPRSPPAADKYTRNQTNDQERVPLTTQLGCFISNTPSMSASLILVACAAHLGSSGWRSPT